jgi:hypothetical protein
VPSNNWEAFFQSLHSGDARGVWFAASGPLLKYFALPVVGLSLVVKIATGEGLPVRIFCLLALSWGGPGVTASALQAPLAHYDMLIYS